jgi:hypothetical protein
MISLIRNIRQRANLIRKATPNCLKDLYEMQNRICDLCNQPIQDLILAHVDHSYPVIKYARILDIPLEDAIKECNNLKNLRCVHFSCNIAKGEKTREEWYAMGLNEREISKNLTKKQILDLKFRFGAGGRKSTELLSTEELSIRGHKGGLVTASIPGHMSRIGGMRHEGKSLGCSKRNSLYGNPSTPESCSRAGIASAAKLTSEQRKERSNKAVHSHYHVRRGVLNPTCSFCFTM